MKWETKSFEALCIDDLYDMLKLRVDVFVVEQNCPYPEIDNKDKHPETYLEDGIPHLDMVLHR